LVKVLVYFVLCDPNICIVFYWSILYDGACVCCLLDTWELDKSTYLNQFFMMLQLYNEKKNYSQYFNLMLTAMLLCNTCIVSCCYVKSPIVRDLQKSISLLMSDYFVKQYFSRWIWQDVILFLTLTILRAYL
jgi:hypothetical protein